MKKGTKIFLACLAGVVVLTGVGVGVSLSTNNMSGTIVENPEVGSGEYDWVKYDVDLPSHTISNEKYYTNCGDDHITTVCLTRSKSGFGGYHNEIYYDQDFNISDDLEAFFVLKKDNLVYQTKVETSHIAVALDEIELPDEDEYGNDMLDYVIKEIWVRTVD